MKLKLNIRSIVIFTVSFLLMLALLASLALAGCSAPAPAPAPAPATTAPAPAPAPSPSPTAKPAPAPTQTPTPAPTTKAVVLRAISFQFPTASTTAHFKLYINWVNERAKGKLTIQYVGGQELMNSADMPMAVMRGVVDIVYIPFTFYGGIVPIGHAMQLSQISGKEERARGVWDLVREMHTKVGFYWLGRDHSSMNADTITTSTKMIKSINDFKGLKAGAGSLLTRPFATALGMSYIQLPAPDVYTALERGIIHCYMVPATAQINAQVQKIAKTMIDHPYFRAPTSVFMNLEKYNGLPKDLQAVLTGVLIDYEEELNKNRENTIEADRKTLVDAGVIPVKFSPEEEKKYLDLAYESTKEDVLKQYPGTAKLLELMKK